MLMTKNIVPIVGVSVALGLALGWLLRPGSSGEPADAEPMKHQTTAKRQSKDDVPTDSPRSTKRPRVQEKDSSEEDRKPQVKTLMLGPGGELDEAKMDAIREQMQAAMDDRQKKIDDGRTAEWVEKLGLSTEQEEALKNHLAKRREAKARLMNGEIVDNSLDLLTGDGMDEFVANELSDEQKENYAKAKEEKQQRQVETRALKDFAKLNEVVALREDQREEAYNILHERAKVASQAADPSEGLVGGITGSLGLGAGDLVEGITGSLGLGSGGDMHIEGMTLPGGGADGAAAMEQLEQQQKARVDQQVEELSGVLDEQQLGSYRRHLESQQSGFRLLQAE
jgi:hypothetical protein